MNDRSVSAPPFERLTEAQLVCLRLVHQHQTSKQIALLLGISRYTADQRIERACRTLGIEGRVQAALLLAEHERGTTTDRLVHEPIDIAAPAPAGPSDGTPVAKRPDDEIHVAQEQAAYRPHPEIRRSIWDVAIPRGNANDLTATARIMWIVQLTVMIVVAILILLVVAEALSGIAERNWPSKTATNL